MNRCRMAGFTLVEVLLAVLTLSIAFAALLGAFLSQITLNEHARNLSLAVHDANRVIERIRQDNLNCTSPTINPTGVPTSWDAWLQTEVKSVPTVSSSTEERIVVTCLQQSPSTPPLNPADYCGTGGTAQVGTGEWRVNAGTTSFDPLQVTVSVCWRHRSRTIGECTWTGGTLVAADGGNGPNDVQGVVESPASLTTLVTCRG